MTAQRIQAIETSQELPVESLYQEALNGFMAVHKELSKLPQDPSDPLMSSQGLLRDAGVDVDNDFSSLIMGAMGTVATDLGLEAMGLPTNGTLSMGVDIASGILMGLSEEREQGRKASPAQNKKLGTTSMFRRAVANKPAAPKAAPNTQAFKNAMKRKQALAVKSSAKRRADLKKQMVTHLENLKELSVFKSCGVKYAHKVTVPNATTGQKETYLVAAKDKPQMALSANGKSYQKPIDLSMMPSMAPNAPKFGFAA